MTPEQLKASILQYAIQGKLVEQRTEEGSAEELYIRIQEEKSNLIKEGKIKKEKPLADITETEKPFDIPENWKWVSVSNLLYFQQGVQVSTGEQKKEAFENSVKFLRIINFTQEDDDYRYVDKKHISQAAIVDETDLVMVRYGATAGKIFWGKDGLLANNLFTINSYSKEMYSAYIKLFFETAYVYNSIIGDKSDTAMPSINFSALNKLYFPLPPALEQYRIVAKLEEILPFIDRYAEAYEKLEKFNAKFPEDMKKSILQYAIQGKLVEQRPEEGTAEELYQQIQEEKQKLIAEKKIKKEKPLAEITEDDIPLDIPDSWRWVRFNDLCAILTCGYASTPQYVSEDVGMPFISAKNVKPYRFIPEDHKFISKELYTQLTSTCKPEQGDILLTRVGAGIGEAAIIDVNMEFAIYVSLTLIKLVNNNLINNKYILYWLNSPLGTAVAQSNILGKGASQGNLNVKNVREFLVPLPPLEEQKRIVSKIEELLPYCDQLIK